MAGFVFFFGPRLPHIRLSACVSFPSNSAVHCFHAFPASFLASSASSFGSLWDAQSCLASFNASCRPKHPKIRKVFCFPPYLFMRRAPLANRVSGPLQPPPLTSPPPPRRLTYPLTTLLSFAYFLFGATTQSDCRSFAAPPGNKVGGCGLPKWNSPPP